METDDDDQDDFPPFGRTRSVMATSLNMAEQLLEMGRQAALSDRRPDAFSILRRLLSMRELPRRVSEEGHASLGELYLKEGQYHKARRCLSIALAHNPTSAHYHFLMGRCHDWDEEADDNEAIQHYRVATELSPRQALFHSVYGLLLTYMNDGVEGTEHLRRAVELNPTDPEIRYNYCVGLLNTGDYDLAEQEVRTMLAARPNELPFQQVFDELQRLRDATAKKPAIAFGLRDQVIPWPYEDQADTNGAPSAPPPRAKPEELPHLSARSHLKPAVGKLSVGQVRQVAAQYGLTSSGAADEVRARVVDALRHAEALTRAVKALDAPVRAALQAVLDEGGWQDAEALVRQFEPASAEPPWHAAWESPSVLTPLRHWGLVYLGRVKGAGRVRIGAIVPLELRGLLTSVLLRN